MTTLRLDATSDPTSTIVWFVLLGLGLSPVIVGAPDVIVSNAAIELVGRCHRTWPGGRGDFLTS